jgi:hypothetical protein
MSNGELRPPPPLPLIARPVKRILSKDNLLDNQVPSGCCSWNRVVQYRYQCGRHVQHHLSLHRARITAEGLHDPTRGSSLGVALAVHYSWKGPPREKHHHLSPSFTASSRFHAGVRQGLYRRAQSEGVPGTCSGGRRYMVWKRAHPRIVCACRDIKHQPRQINHALLSYIGADEQG